MIILVTPELPEKAKALLGVGIVHELPAPSPTLLYKCLTNAARDLANQHTEQAGQIASLVDEQGLSLATKLGTYPRVVRFVQRYLLDVSIGAIPLAQALADLESLRYWFLDTLAGDPDSWVAALALTLCLPGDASSRTPWLRFDLLRRSLARLLQRELGGPRNERSLESFCQTDERTLRRIEATGPPGRFLQFRDPSVAVRLWDVLLGPGRGILSVILPVLEDLAEGDEIGLGHNAARALGRIGQVDPDLITMPLIDRWSKLGGAPDFRLGFLLEGTLGATDLDYRRLCVDAYLRRLDLGSEPEILGLAAIAQSDLGFALEQLQRVLSPLAQELDWPAASAASRALAAEEARLRKTRRFNRLHELQIDALWRLTRRLVPKEKIGVLAAARAVITLLAVQYPEPVRLVEALVAWSRSDPEKLAPLVTILVLHPDGVMAGWLHRGPAATTWEACTTILAELAEDQALVSAMRDLVVEVYRGLAPVPGRFRSLLEERVTVLLADWATQAVGTSTVRPAMTRLLAALYESSEPGLGDLVLQAARETNPEPERSALHELALDALTGQGQSVAAPSPPGD